MDRVKKLKVKKSDGSFTDYIPIGADAQYIDLENGSNVEESISKMIIQTNKVPSIEQDNDEVLYYFNPQSSTLINTRETKTIHGECNIIKAYGKIIMIDTGGTNRSESIKQYLQSIGVSKVDYLIISHWHYDHCTNFYQSMADYIDWSDCVCYFPLDNPSWAIQDESFYTPCVNFANNNCKQVIFPVDNDKLIINDNFSIEFYNCGNQAFQEIKEIQDDIEEFAGHYDGWYANQYYVNDYSLIALVRHNNTKVLYSGDVMKAGQERMLRHKFIKDVDLYKMHHHGVNKIEKKQCIVHYQYCQYINPKNVVVLNDDDKFGQSNNYRTDVGFFQTEQIYQASLKPIIYSSKQNNLSLIQIDKIWHGMNSVDTLKLYIFADLSAYQSQVPDADGSYWRPYGHLGYALNTSARSMQQKTNLPLGICLVALPGDCATQNEISYYGFQSEAMLCSYDYYKNPSQFKLDDNKHLTAETEALIDKYKFRGRVIVGVNSSLKIQGISFRPNNETIQKKYLYDNSIISVYRDGNIDLGYCKFSYEDAIEQLATEKSTSYNGVTISFCSNAGIYSCKFEEMISCCVSKNSNSIFDLDYVTINKCIRIHEGHNSTLRIKANAFNLTNLDYPTAFDATYNWIKCFSLHGRVDMMIDPNETIKYQGKIMSFTDFLLYHNPFTISYRNYQIGDELVYLKEQQNRKETSRTIAVIAQDSPSSHVMDAYGAYLKDFSLGAIQTKPGYDLKSIGDSISWNLNNLKRPGVWYISGAGATSKYTNCPITMNGRISCINIAGDYWVQQAEDRGGNVFKRYWDPASGTSANHWSNWIRIQEAATWPKS